MNTPHTHIDVHTDQLRPMAAYPHVSIVTPVYNGAKHIAECIESVLRQDYPHWDYTIVNNCSTDDTYAIAQAYAAKDSRITVHNNAAYVRAVGNHNIAIRHISPDSKYCKVLFGDDWLFPTCVRRMVEVAEAFPSVGIVGSYGLRGTQLVRSGLPYVSTVVPGREAGRMHFLSGANYFGSATSVLYRSSLIRQRDSFYNEGNLHADTEACLQLLQECDFGFVHEVLTFTRVQDDTLSSLSHLYKTFLPATVHHLIRYGPLYLSEDECEQRLGVMMTGYYAILAQAAFELRDLRFWKLHRQKLKEMGLPLNHWRLAAVIAKLAFNKVINPGNTIAALWRRLVKPPRIARPSARSR